MIRQRILPFKVEMTKDLITPHAGLALLGEFTVGLGLLKAVDKYLPKPGSGAGYKSSEYVFPLTLMLNGGGRSLEETREIRDDEGLREILPLQRVPSSDATGDWLRRMGLNGALEGLEKVNKRSLKRGRNSSRTRFASPMVLAPARRNSATSLSWKVPLARSTRPFASGLRANTCVTPSSRMARPNWVGLSLST